MEDWKLVKTTRQIPVPLVLDCFVRKDASHCIRVQWKNMWWLTFLGLPFFSPFRSYYHSGLDNAYVSSFAFFLFRERKIPQEQSAVLEVKTWLRFPVFLLLFPVLFMSVLSFGFSKAFLFCCHAGVLPFCEMRLIYVYCLLYMITKEIPQGCSWGWIPKVALHTRV